MDTRHESRDGVLKDQQEHGRQRTQSCKERQRILIENDGYDDDARHEHQDNLHHA